MSGERFVSSRPRCQCYTERVAQTLPSGSKRHARCKREATVDLDVMTYSVAGESVRRMRVCGLHAAMHQEGRHIRIEQDERPWRR